MQPVVGQPRDSFGFVGTSAPSPIVDLLAPAADTQSRLLGAKAALLGVALNASTAGSPADAATTTTPSPAPPGPSWGDRVATPAVAVQTPAPAAVPVPAGTAVAPVPLQNFLQPAKRPEPAAAGEPAPAARASIAKRLETLRQLLDQKLITEAEFKQQRERILNEL